MIITSGNLKGRKVTAPDEGITRPTLSKIRMGVFNTLQSMIDFEESSFLDMYAGSGIMALEAVSRGFAKAVCIEKNPKVAQVLKLNWEKLPLICSADTFSHIGEKGEIIIGNSLKVVPKLTEEFDVIYIDPPYSANIYQDSLKAVKNIAGGIVVLEHTTNESFDGFELIKQKKYGDKILTYLRLL